MLLYLCRIKYIIVGTISELNALVSVSELAKDDALARKKASVFCITIVGIVMLIYKAEQKQYLNSADDL